MTKKIFALVMVISVIGGILAGCSAPTEGEKAKETAGATTAGAETKKEGE
jgi:uncharacterized protein YceK